MWKGLFSAVSSATKGTIETGLSCLCVFPVPQDSIAVAKK